MKTWGMFRFTVEEAIRKGTLIFYFAVATLIIVVFGLGLSRSHEDPNTIMMFGKQFFPNLQNNVNPAQVLLILLQKQSVGSILLFGIFGVAGLVPAMLEKGTIELFISKPISRTGLLLARAFGAVAGIAVNLVYFILGIWLVFGIKLGFWHSGFLLSSVFVCFAFACYFSVVALVGLMTRSTGFSIILAFLFSVISSGLEMREMGLYRIWDNAAYHRTLDVLYYITPQLDAMLKNSTRLIGELPYIPSTGDFTLLPYVYSLLSSSLLYAFSIFHFSRQDF